MIYNKVTAVIDMLDKMIGNKDDYEAIGKMLEASYPNLKKDLLLSDIKNCTSCGLYACNHVPFEGPISSDIMFIGEAPGEEDEQKGSPFSGKSGQILNSMLKAAEENIHERWNRKNIYLTNVVKCRPKDNKGSNRKPSVEEMASCRPILFKEVELVKPKVIVCLGSIAASTMIHPDFNILEDHGKWFGSEKQDHKMIAIHHPNFVLHQGIGTEMGKERKREMWADLIKINEYLDTK